MSAQPPIAPVAERAVPAAAVEQRWLELTPQSVGMALAVLLVVVHVLMLLVVAWQYLAPPVCDATGTPCLLPAFPDALRRRLPLSLLRAPDDEGPPQQDTVAEAGGTLLGMAAALPRALAQLPRGTLLVGTSAVAALPIACYLLMENML